MACTVISTDLYVTLFVFCRLMSTQSKNILDLLSQPSFFPLCLPFFCPVVLIWSCATGTPLVSLFSSSQGENEGTPTQKWGVQLYSLKIIGLCSIKAQRCSFDLAGSVFFICVFYIHINCSELAKVLDNSF